MERQIANPIPVPSVLVLKNGSNIFASATSPLAVWFIFGIIALRRRTYLSALPAVSFDLVSGMDENRLVTQGFLIAKGETKCRGRPYPTISGPETMRRCTLKERLG
jgi:hypothetical protein